MVSFWVYDVAFLVLFTVLVAWFLYRRKKDLSRQGIIFMYRTQFGVKAINWIGDNFRGFLKAIKFVIIGIGVLLMGSMLWMLGQTLSIYIKHPEVTEVIKAPPIAPLIPYFPKLFGMESFFPPFYFTYFLVALAIVAIVHEFSHGIFMRAFKIKIKSTGMVFLGPLLGAFVEEEKSNFEKKKNSEQMTVLGAGVFANLLFALIFYGLYVLFFFSSFTASGYIFNTYGLASVPLENITGFSEEGNFTKVMTLGGKNFYIDENLAVQLNRTDISAIIAYPEAPAVLHQMGGVIVQADDVKIRHQEDLRAFLENKNPGDKVSFTTNVNGELVEYGVELGASPDDETKPYLGVGHFSNEPRGVIQNLFAGFMKFKEPSTYYTPRWDGNFVYFIYHFIWWVMIINLLVALFNMLPVGMLDGGRFFYLAILSVTRSKKVASLAYKGIAYAILFVFLLLMFYWFVGVV